MVDRFERAFIYVTVLVLLVFFTALIVSTVGPEAASLQDDNGSIDPAAVRSTPPFDEPGVFPTEDGGYRAVVIAKAWQFEPDEIRVPAGAEVTFLITSQDVIHGFMVPETRVNGMAIPGRITQITQRFDEPGEHTIVCHEFCGVGHNSMFGRVVVEG